MQCSSPELSLMTPQFTLSTPMLKHTLLCLDKCEQVYDRRELPARMNTKYHAMAKYTHGAQSQNPTAPSLRSRARQTLATYCMISRGGRNCTTAKETKYTAGSPAARRKYSRGSLSGCCSNPIRGSRCAGILWEVRLQHYLRTVF